MGLEWPTESKTGNPTHQLTQTNRTEKRGRSTVAESRLSYLLLSRLTFIPVIWFRFEHKYTIQSSSGEQLGRGGMSSMNDQVLELKNKINECQEETLQLLQKNQCLHDKYKLAEQAKQRAAAALTKQFK
uniref:uncharacterized protein LOC105352962 n=1 Tax=Fragaria vesca subsp. vesca TaxID=101020 RepID=UPI0005C8FBB7|nr:PREDICTED: uncharacterized protein LOC105352962 [Fragaria vesca subsp. vesca]